MSRYKMFEQQALDLARKHPHLFQFTAAGRRLPMVAANGAFDIALDHKGVATDPPCE